MALSGCVPAESWPSTRNDAHSRQQEQLAPEPSCHRASSGGTEEASDPLLSLNPPKNTPAVLEAAHYPSARGQGTPGRLSGEDRMHLQAPFKFPG